MRGGDLPSVHSHVIGQTCAIGIIVSLIAAMAHFLLLTKTHLLFLLNLDY
jgi:hypothetical protein